MGANLTRLLEHGDGERLTTLVSLQLCQTKGSRHPGGAATHNQNVDV
jgi:hypothetical protein